MPNSMNGMRNAGIGLALMLAATTAGQSADLGAKDEPIKLAMLEWTGAHVSTHIAGQLMQKLGASLGTTVNHFNNAHKELKKVDKDVVKIAGNVSSVEPLLIDPPRFED